MPTTTWETMRQDIVRPMGLVTGATSTNLATNTSLIDNDLTDLYPGDDYFNNNWFVIVTSNANDGEYRRITDYAQSSGTLTVSKVWGSGDSSDTTFELMTVPPNQVMNWYNRVRQEVWPHIGIVRDVETVVTGTRQFTYTVPSTIRKINRIYLGERYEAQNDSENLLLNGSFENWSNSTTADNWGVIVGDTTVNQEEQTTSPTNYAVLSGNNSARLIVPSSEAVTLAQTFNSASSSYTDVATQGMEANLSAWVYCTVSGRVSLTIDGQIQSETHGGTGWELLKGSETLTQNDTATIVGISVTSGVILAVYIDEIFLTLGQSGPLDRPYTPVTNWNFVPPADGASSGGTLRFTGKIPSHHRIRIVGSDMLSSVSTDASTVEVDGDLLEPLYNRVRERICDEMSGGRPDSYWYTLARQFGTEYTRAVESGAVGLKVPRPRFKAPSMLY
jgi:hypothetical protein